MYLVQIPLICLGYVNLGIHSINPFHTPTTYTTTGCEAKMLECLFHPCKDHMSLPLSPSLIQLPPQDRNLRAVQTLQHVMVSIVSHCKDVRRHLCLPLAPVHVDHCLGVDRKHAVRIDGDTEQARVGLHTHTQT